MNTRMQVFQRLLIACSVLLILAGLLLRDYQTVQIVVLGLAALGPVGWLWLDWLERKGR